MAMLIYLLTHSFYPDSPDKYSSKGRKRGLGADGPHQTQTSRGLLVTFPTHDGFLLGCHSTMTELAANKEDDLEAISLSLQSGAG